MSINPLYLQDKIADGVIATIPANGTASNVKSLGGGILIAIDMPSAFDGTSLRVKTGETPESLLDCYDSLGNQLTIVAGPSRRILLSAYDFRAVKYIQFIADQQSASRALTFITGDLP